MTTSDDGQKLVPLSQYSQLVGGKQEVEEVDEEEGAEGEEVTDIVVEEGEGGEEETSA